MMTQTLINSSASVSVSWTGYNSYILDTFVGYPSLNLLNYCTLPSLKFWTYSKKSILDDLKASTNSSHWLPYSFMITPFQITSLIYSSLILTIVSMNYYKYLFILLLLCVSSPAIIIRSIAVASDSLVLRTVTNGVITLKILQIKPNGS